MPRRSSRSRQGSRTTLAQVPYATHKKHQEKVSMKKRFSRLGERSPTNLKVTELDGGREQVVHRNLCNGVGMDMYDISILGVHLHH